MTSLVYEASVLALWLALPLLAALVVAGIVSTALGWWLGHVDVALSSGLRWVLVLIAIAVTARTGGARLVAFADKAFAAAPLASAPTATDRTTP